MPEGQRGAGAGKPGSPPGKGADECRSRTDGRGSRPAGGRTRSAGADVPIRSRSVPPVARAGLCDHSLTGIPSCVLRASPAPAASPAGNAATGVAVPPRAFTPDGPIHSAMGTHPRFPGGCAARHPAARVPSRRARRTMGLTRRSPSTQRTSCSLAGTDRTPGHAERGVQSRLDRLIPAEAGARDGLGGVRRLGGVGSMSGISLLVPRSLLVARVPLSSMMREASVKCQWFEYFVTGAWG
jgi:hypothetical protein